MPTFVSNRGKWSPAKEEITLTNAGAEPIESKCIFGTKKPGVAMPGEGFVYRGPDREAIKMLNEQGQETLGQDFKTDPEFRQIVRNQGFNSTEEYLEYLGYDEEADKKKFEQTAETVKAHEMPKMVREIKVMGGGQDRSGSGNKENDSIGGFGTQRQRKPEELSK